MIKETSKKVKHLECRGENKRIEICKKYKVKPVAHFRLLNGISIESDAGDELINEYYIFNVFDKNTNELVFNCYVGSHVANSFSKILQIPLPPIFNPLRNDRIPNNNAKTHEGNSKQNKSWNPARKELYNLVNLILLWLGKIDTSKSFFQIRTELEDYNYIEYYPKELLYWFSKTFSKLIYKNPSVSVKVIIDELSKNNNLRDFSFENLKEYANKRNITIKWE